MMRFLIVFMLVLGALVACGGDGNEQSAIEATTPISTLATPTEEALSATPTPTVVATPTFTPTPSPTPNVIQTTTSDQNAEITASEHAYLERLQQEVKEYGDAIALLSLLTFDGVPENLSERIQWRFDLINPMTTLWLAPVVAESDTWGTIPARFQQLHDSYVQMVMDMNEYYERFDAIIDANRMPQDDEMEDLSSGISEVIERIQPIEQQISELLS